MTKCLPLSSRIYGRLLVLYPDDLRRDYGADMALVFAEDLDMARQEAGMRGVIRVWRCALGELLRFALPGCASHPAVMVPAIWFAFSFAIMSFEIAMEMRHTPVVMTPFHAVCAALLLPALTTPLFSLVTIWACRSGTVISLGLSNRAGGKL